MSPFEVRILPAYIQDRTHSGFDPLLWSSLNRHTQDLSAGPGRPWMSTTRTKKIIGLSEFDNFQKNNEDQDARGFENRLSDDRGRQHQKTNTINILNVINPFSKRARDLH